MEHERAKEPMPVRPPRPHPQGFVLCLTDAERDAMSKQLHTKNWWSSNRPK